MELIHKSVLLNEAVDGLKVKPGGTYVDGTLGGGGHSYEICKRLDATGKLIGIDQDEEAIKRAGERLKEFGEVPVIVRNNYFNFASVLDGLGIDRVDGILLDLGVSSFQIDDPNRGFSYMSNSRLDMRMDRRNDLTAEKIINEYDEKTLSEILKVYGEERFARSIASNIVKARKEKRIETTGELVDIISRSVPAKNRAKSGHPAKRTFQALRIEVNNELHILEEIIDVMIERLEVGGRLCIITFHSLEDRIVKLAFRRNEDPCICPKDLPVCVCGRRSKGKVITRKPILPGEEELEENSRAKSAKLRIFERR